MMTRCAAMNAKRIDRQTNRHGLRMRLYLLLLLLCSPLAVQADNTEPSTGNQYNEHGIAQGIDWQSLSTEEQTLLAPFAEKWAGLPPGRQQSLRKGIKRWTQLTPEQRARVKERFARWQQLPPEQREQVRRRFEHFMSLPPEERQRLRERFRSFRDLPAERREALRERWRQLSPAQRRAVIERRQIRQQTIQRREMHR